MSCFAFAQKVLFTQLLLTLHEPHIFQLRSIKKKSAWDRGYRPTCFYPLAEDQFITIRPSGIYRLRSVSIMLLFYVVHAVSTIIA